jgi:nicotinic acid mononucleotide adenylyltransferase
MVRPNHKGRSGLMMFPTGVRKYMKRLDDGIYEHGSGRKVCLQFVTQLDISATRIRASVNGGKSIRYLVPSTVEKYIKERKLYQ